MNEHMSTTQLLGILAILLVLVLIAYVLSPKSPDEPAVVKAVKAVKSDDIRMGATPIPEFTEATKKKLEASLGFDSLISYTDAGFEPAAVSIQRGDTLRFTNNSSGDLWIAADGRDLPVYPRTKQGCGSSDLDSCDAFSPQDFWEFTFAERGVWHVVNALDKSKRVVVTVTVE